jgi:hypothetical protein
MKKILSNQALATLSKLSHKMRKLIGPVKVNNMVADEQYAFSVLVEAVLSEQDELISLSKKVSQEVGIEHYLINALIAYCHELNKRNKRDQSIHNSKNLISALAEKLYGVSFDGASYRNAINQLILDLEESKKHFCIDIARTFYPYWIKANETLAEADKNEYLLEKVHKESLMDLWQALQGKTLSTSDNQKLNRYLDTMHKVKLAEREIEVRNKIAKLILIEQHHYALTSDGYRQNIKKIISLISSARLQDYVLDVAREFHHFCLNT